MLEVGWQNRFEERKVQSQTLTLVRQRTQVLRQTRAAKCEPRLQVSRRSVQSGIPAQRGHNFVPIDAQARRQSSDFVSEVDFNGMERVTGVLDQLGRFE